jgi:hypothetical protein
MPADDVTARGPEPPERIRPFVLTSGRVAGTETYIGLDTQVSTRGGRRPVDLTPELVSILSLCTEPISVAEVSALVPLHFGVARVLITDLLAAGLVDVFTTDEALAEDPDVILRVIRGLRQLT